MPLSSLRKDLRGLTDAKKAQVLSRFFKTGPGEYGEGSKFLGVTVPKLRAIAGRHPDLSLAELEVLLASPLHEERAVALMILSRLYSKGDEERKKTCFEFYLRNIDKVNNWDLVDGSAPGIVGARLARRSRAPLRRWANSKSLWRRRIAILATFHFIKQGEFEETLHIAEMLLDDKEDLIHKAVGWMLREVGKRDLAAEQAFLRAHCKQMPRTMLRYAIERFPEKKRKAYLAGTVS